MLQHGKKQKMKANNSQNYLKGKPSHFYLAKRIYFVTTHTFNFVPLFLNPKFAQIFCQQLAKLQKVLNLPIYSYSILHHHFHWMVETSQKNSLDYIMFRLKGASSREINKVRGKTGKLWQDRYVDHVIRDERDFGRHLDYIHYNAVKHELVDKPENWPYSSFRHYLNKG